MFYIKGWFVLEQGRALVAADTHNPLIKHSAEHLRPLAKIQEDQVCYVSPSVVWGVQCLTTDFDGSPLVPLGLPSILRHLICIGHKLGQSCFLEKEDELHQKSGRKAETQKNMCCNFPFVNHYTFSGLSNEVNIQLVYIIKSLCVCFWIVCAQLRALI